MDYSNINILFVVFGGKLLPIETLPLHTHTSLEGVLQFGNPGFRMNYANDLCT